MAKISITLDHPIQDGEDVKFKAPCDCTAVDGLLITYPVEEGVSTQSEEFGFRDTHGNDLTGIGNLFAANAYVKVILNTLDKVAFIQNAGTNTYIENHVKNHTHTPDSIGAAAASVASTVSLSGWADNAVTVNVAGVTVSSHVIVTPHPDTFVIWADSMVRATTQGDGTLTFVCEDVPSEEVKANILIVG